MASVASAGVQGTATLEVHAYLRISEVADRVGRRPHTIRLWERLGVLPAELRPSRNVTRHRIWTPEQVEALEVWSRQRRRGYPPRVAA